MARDRHEGHPKFNVGDQVVLRSGGPNMTITELKRDLADHFTGYYGATWFAGKKNERGSFPEAALDQAPTNK